MGKGRRNGSRHLPDMMGCRTRGHRPQLYCADCGEKVGYDDKPCSVCHSSRVKW